MMMSQNMQLQQMMLQQMISSSAASRSYAPENTFNHRYYYHVMLVLIFELCVNTFILQDVSSRVLKLK